MNANIATNVLKYFTHLGDLFFVTFHLSKQLEVRVYVPDPSCSVTAGCGQSLPFVVKSNI